MHVYIRVSLYPSLRERRDVNVFVRVLEKGREGDPKLSSLVRPAGQSLGRTTFVVRAERRFSLDRPDDSFRLECLRRDRTVISG